MPRIGCKVTLDLASPGAVLFLPCDDPPRTNHSLSSRTLIARDSGSFHARPTSHIQDDTVMVTVSVKNRIVPAFCSGHYTFL
jgi:hypothetical protein